VFLMLCCGQSFGKYLYEHVVLFDLFTVS